jgi:hypothetical protein
MIVRIAPPLIVAVIVVSATGFSLFASSVGSHVLVLVLFLVGSLAWAYIVRWSSSRSR